MEIEMNQLELDLQYGVKINTLNSAFNLLNFSPIKVHDRLKNESTSAYRYFYINDHNLKININIIPNETFVPSGYVYFDTLHYSSWVLNALSEMKKGNSETIEVYCYMNLPKGVVINNVNKNLKIIINSYLISSDVLRTAPNQNTEQHSWLTYDPSVSMYSINYDFIFENDVDYSSTPQCYYRTSSSGKVGSLKYPYANSSIMNVCSNSILEKEAQKIGSVCQCPFSGPKQIVACPYYKEDKFKLATLDLYSRPVGDTKSLSDYLHSKTIDSYLVRGISNDSYSILFIQKDHKTDQENLIKHLVYENISFNNLEDRTNLIKEARSQLTVILSDYVLDYAHKITNHVESALDLKEAPERETKKSYLSALSS
jgi:hypothetical protein